MMKLTRYQIRVQGHIDPTWQDWLPGLTLTHTPKGETLLTGLLADQAALQGVLTNLYNLGYPLLSVNSIDQEIMSSNKEEDL
ncbi:hypothetical protein KSF_009840 [Reticulibacter mediterranei]|uniref:Uncharacterized protein n=1 Tax=Reticulibacter mediterranei TaxID=2778369 RepID=A0A8J3IJW4_9CHLR|nr:hypothetical protein [Reticulibacter mediterranei]GHO90936.1 hypothetical protein KSF_009840 [Reticulibacter mediterranei]